MCVLQALGCVTCETCSWSSTSGRATLRMTSDALRPVPAYVSQRVAVCRLADDHANTPTQSSAPTESCIPTLSTLSQSSPHRLPPAAPGEACPCEGGRQALFAGQNTGLCEVSCAGCAACLYGWQANIVASPPVPLAVLELRRALLTLAGGCCLCSVRSPYAPYLTLPLCPPHLRLVGALFPQLPRPCTALVVWDWLCCAAPLVALVGRRALCLPIPWQHTSVSTKEVPTRRGAIGDVCLLAQPTSLPSPSRLFFHLLVFCHKPLTVVIASRNGHALHTHCPCEIPLCFPPSWPLLAPRGTDPEPRQSVVTTENRPGFGPHVHHGTKNLGNLTSWVHRPRRFLSFAFLLCAYLPFGLGHGMEEGGQGRGRCGGVLKTLSRCAWKVWWATEPGARARERDLRPGRTQLKSPHPVVHLTGQKKHSPQCQHPRLASATLLRVTYPEYHRHSTGR